MRECFLIPLTNFTLSQGLNYQKTKDLGLATFKFDFECSYANHTSTNTNYAKF